MNNIKIFFLIGVFIITTFCSLSLKAEILDRIVAVVGNEVVTLSEVEEAVKGIDMGKKDNTKDNIEQFKKEVLDGLIDDLLLKSAMQKADIKVEDEELARAIGNVLAQNRMTPDQLKKDLAKQGVSYETYKIRLSNQIKMYKFVNQVIGPQVKITDRELRNYFDRNKEKFGGKEVKFKNKKDEVQDALYEEKSQEALRNYLIRQRQKTYVDIRL